MLFLDEIHRMSRGAEEMLYLAMEDFRVDVIVGKGPARRPSRWSSHRSRWWAPPPGQACCPPRCATASASPATSTSTPRRTSSRSCTAPRGCSTSRPTLVGIGEIARRSRGTPRIANRLLRRVRDWAQVHGNRVVDEEAAHAALALFDVDDRGLDRLDRAVLEALCRRFAGGPGRASARWRWPSARSPTRSRPWPSPSSCGRGSWRAPREGGQPPPSPGTTSGSPRPPEATPCRPRSRSRGSRDARRLSGIPARMPRRAPARGVRAAAGSPPARRRSQLERGPGAVRWLLWCLSPTLERSSRLAPGLMRARTLMLGHARRTPHL